VNPETSEATPPAFSHEPPGTATLTPAPHPLGFWERVALTFAAPRRLFATSPESLPWAGVLLLSTAIAMIAAAALPPDYFLTQMEGAVNRRGAPVEITSDPAEVVRWGRYLYMFSAAAGHPLVVLAIAGALTLLFGLPRGTARLVRYLPIAAHGSLILAVGALVANALTALTPDLRVEPSLAGVLAPLGLDDARSAFPGAINLFSLWTIGVLAVGVAVVDRVNSWLRPAALLLALYLLLAFFTSLLA
jgi:hypothetical protein